MVIILSGTIWEASQLNDGGWASESTLLQHMLLTGRIQRVGTVPPGNRALPHFDAK
jgi:hypothetical protein